MLTSSSTLRKSTATACLACARAASSASSSSPSPRRFLPATTRAVTPPVLSKRYTASFAQPSDSIQTQSRLGEEQSRLNDEDSADQDAEQALADVYAAIEPAPPSPSPAAPLPTTLEALMAEKVVDQGPTVSDLVPLLPRRFRIPNASSPDSHRTIYRNTFDKTVDKLAKSFSKLQLFDIASNKRTGFGIDVRAKDTISKLKLGTPENKRKFWLPKRLDQMSKRELIHTILIVKNDMVHPGVVPRPNTGPSVTDSMSLSDRILFLLLSPNCHVMSRIANHFDVKVSFARHPETNVVSLILTGSSAGVKAARAEVESMDEVTEKKLVELRTDVTTLRPEVYQTISRLAKTFLEPGPRDNTLVASAVEPKSLVRLNRYLSTALASDHVRQSTSLFASVPTALTHVEYGLVPHEPLSSSFEPGPLSSLAGATNSFARFKSLPSYPAATARGERLEFPGQRSTKLEHESLDEWSERMGLEKTSRIPINVPFSSSSKHASSVFQALFRPFELVDAEEGRQESGDKFELRAELGHLVFPVYREPPSPTSEAYGPAKGATWENWLDWLKRRVRNETVWIPSPPRGYMQSIQILDSSSPPPPSPTSSFDTPMSDDASRFDALFFPPASSKDTDRGVHSESPFALSEQEKEAIASVPRFESERMLRRLVYYPAQLPAPNEIKSEDIASEEGAPSSPAAQQSSPPSRIEIVIAPPTKDGYEPGADPSVRRSRVEVKLVQESQVDMFVPGGQRDIRLKLSRRKTLGEHDLEMATSTLPEDEYESVFELFSRDAHKSPFELVYNSQPYFLHTGSFVRHTVISAPPLRATSTREDKVALEDRVQIVQESIHKFLPETPAPDHPHGGGPRSKTVEFVLTNGQEWTKEEIRNGKSTIVEAEGAGDAEARVEVAGNAQDMNEATTRTTPGWKTILAQLEEKCL